MRPGIGVTVDCRAGGSFGGYPPTPELAEGSFGGFRRLDYSPPSFWGSFCQFSEFWGLSADPGACGGDLGVLCYDGSAGDRWVPGIRAWLRAGVGELV